MLFLFQCCMGVTGANCLRAWLGLKEIEFYEKVK
jgi:hypothetical protein